MGTVSRCLLMGRHCATCGSIRLPTVCPGSCPALFQALVLAGLSYHLAGAAAVDKRIPRQDLPVVNALGKAWLLVLDRRSAVKPKDSLTGRYALTTNMGVPATWDIWPRFLFRTP